LFFVDTVAGVVVHHYCLQGVHVAGGTDIEAVAAVGLEHFADEIEAIPDLY